MPSDLSLDEIESRIALIRQNLDELGEQAAGSSGAADEDRTAARIEEQQEELAKLLDARNAYLADRAKRGAS